MDEVIELSITSADGVVDCRLEAQQEEDRPFYFSATILYPNLVDGFSRSEIYCYNMRDDGTTRNFQFEENEEYIPQKIRVLEDKLSEAIAAYLRQ